MSSQEESQSNFSGNNKRRKLSQADYSFMSQSVQNNEEQLGSSYEEEAQGDEDMWSLDGELDPANWWEISAGLDNKERLLDYGYSCFVNSSKPIDTVSLSQIKVDMERKVIKLLKAVEEVRNEVLLLQNKIADLTVLISSHS